MKTLCVPYLENPKGARVQRLLYRCTRPGHGNGDVHPSLSINTKKDVWMCGPCNAGGTPWRLAAFLAGLDRANKAVVTAWLKEHGLLKGGARQGRNDDVPRSLAKTHDFVKAYDYVDEHGRLLYQNVRFAPKDPGKDKKTFLPRYRNDDGKWTWKALPLEQRTIYNLPDVLSAEVVFWVEGEKDASTGTSLGFVATTSGSSTSWQDRFAEYFVGRNVVVFVDADKPGRDHAVKVARGLYGKAQAIKVIEFSDAGDLTKWIERGHTKEELIELIEAVPEWKPEVIAGAELLMEVYHFVRRFVSLSEHQARVVALWIVHTHVIDSADTTPYLAVTSAEKQCGKTRLLEVMATVVANPWLTGRVTAAVLYRKTDAEHPTLLLEESDAAFGGEKEYAEAVRGILNTGHDRDGVASACVGQGAEMSYKDFSTFCPKAIAVIGKLPDTVADRSIPIRLKRAARGERIERWRRRKMRPEADALRGKIETWCSGIMGALRKAEPPLPEELSDRQQDGAESLLAIADLAGGNWPDVARTGLVQICAEARQADDSIGVRLLVDIKLVFGSKAVDKLFSAELASALAEIETSPWAEWSRGKAMTANQLARQLKKFDIGPHSVRIGDRATSGYELEDFEDAFKRYLAPNMASKVPQRPQPNASAGSGNFSKVPHSSDVGVQKREIVNTGAGCGSVGDKRPITGGGHEDADGGQAKPEGLEV